MLLSDVSVSVVAQSSSKIPEGLMNNLVLILPPRATQPLLVPKPVSYTVSRLDAPISIKVYHDWHSAQNVTLRRLRITIVTVEGLYELKTMSAYLYRGADKSLARPD